MELEVMATRVWERCGIGGRSRASYGSQVNLAERSSRTKGSVVLIVPVPQCLEITEYTLFCRSWRPVKVPTNQGAVTIHFAQRT